jgi:hypothetical protein
MVSLCGVLGHGWGWRGCGVYGGGRWQLEVVLDEVDLTVVGVLFDLNVGMSLKGIGNWAED